MSTWAAATGTWGGAELAHGLARPVFVQGVEFFQADQGTDFDGGDIDVTLERVGLTIAGRDREGKPRTDPSAIKLLRECWPVFRGPVGQTINIYFGAQELPEGAITWTSAFPFTIGTSVSVQPLLDFVYLGIRFQSSGISGWSLLSYDLDVEVIGVAP